MVDIPRIELPSAVSDALKDIDLKNPNDLSTADYNTYSAAAIGGTLALFVPGALVFDVTGTIADFLVSATIGGGVGAYLALRKDTDSVAEAPWSVAEWAVAPRFDHVRAAAPVLLLG